MYFGFCFFCNQQPRISLMRITAMTVRVRDKGSEVKNLHAGHQQLQRVKTALRSTLQRVIGVFCCKDTCRCEDCTAAMAINEHITYASVIWSARSHLHCNALAGLSTSHVGLACPAAKIQML